MTHDTKKVINKKEYLIDTYCQGNGSIAYHNKKVLQEDIQILKAYGQPTFELKDGEETTYLALKPQFAEFTAIVRGK